MLRTPSVLPAPELRRLHCFQKGKNGENHVHCVCLCVCRGWRVVSSKRHPAYHGLRVPVSHGGFTGTRSTRLRLVIHSTCCYVYDQESYQASFFKVKNNYIILSTFSPSTPALYQASFPLVKMQPPSSAYPVENGPEEEVERLACSAACHSEMLWKHAFDVLSL